MRFRRDGILSAGYLLPKELQPALIARLKIMAMLDIAVFFGVLLVGFAYLWKRGDIDWVKTVAAERLAEPSQPAAVFPKPTPAGTLVGAGQQ